jgi:hypothetical protein
VGKYIFVELPEDSGCPCAGEGKNYLNGKRNFSKKHLGVPDCNAIEIGDHNPAEKMRRNIQRRKYAEKLKRTSDQIKQKNTKWRPGGFAQSVHDPGGNLIVSHK